MTKEGGVLGVGRGGGRGPGGDQGKQPGRPAWLARATGSARPAGPSWSPPVVPRLIVPAYFHPAVAPDEWARMAAHAARIRLVILNPASGPGDQPDPAFRPVLDRLREAGVPVAG